ncbi:MAG TPA: 16S rRNA (guanine(527)-N(7))-methyltransferase RsmG [Planctomycetes bacterium]|nr:16S rRNA (guanine(527)-N(7))-methyltransferase RsmG [Planctomycetota bacterium]HIK59101.1 16S rRNA (guanine(527)-N(7))-methyltransferase RsmG [Planctomycetota bacterium]
MTANHTDASEEKSGREEEPTDGELDSPEEAGSGPEPGAPPELEADGLDSELLESALDPDDVAAAFDEEADGGGEDADETEDEASEGDEDSEEQAPKPKGGKSTRRSSTSIDDEGEPGDPDTKVPGMKTMLSALQWAFQDEEGVSAELLEKYAEHARLLLEANKTLNLTAIQTPKDVAAKHYLDCWRMTRLVPMIAKRLLDLGTGAGFPGIPIALAEPNCSVILVDSTRKKVEFVQACIDKLGIPNARAVWARAEDHLAVEKVDIVMARAVSSVRENVRTVRKVRQTFHDFVMLKGKSWSREVRAAERETERLGFHLDTVWEHELPDELGARAILVYRAPGGAGL